MATRPTLAYFAAPELLPAPLPTVAEILESTRFLVRYGGALVVRVGDHFVVKYGKKVNLQEGGNMLFVRQHTSVPVPAVYALFHDEGTGQNFIIQEYVAGKPLDLVWDTLCLNEEMAITCQLRQNMDEMRSIPSPGYYGGHRLVFTHGDLFPGNMIFREDTKTVVIINWGLAGWYPSSWEYCCARRWPNTAMTGPSGCLLSSPSTLRNSAGCRVVANWRFLPTGGYKVGPRRE